MLSVKNTAKKKLPRIDFGAICDYANGKDFEVSLVFIDEEFSLNLNKIFRKKNKPANILSFPLSEKSGEIFICPKIAKAQAKKNGEDFVHYLTTLFIHGLTHLKGYDHGSKMEEEEARIRKFFKL